MSFKSQYSQIKEILYPGINKTPKNIKHIRKLQNMNRVKKQNKHTSFDESNS